MCLHGVNKPYGAVCNMILNDIQLTNMSIKGPMHRAAVKYIPVPANNASPISTKTRVTKNRDTVLMLA